MASPEFIKCGPACHAMLLATIKFGSRDRRRLRREQLKAFAKVRKQIIKEKSSGIT